MIYNLFIIGKKDIDENDQYFHDLARKSLMSLQPKKIIVDYSPGWNSVVLDEARKVGVPYMGALPYDNKNLKTSKIYKAASANIVFNATKKDFLSNPFPYFSWIHTNTNEVLAYYDEEKDVSIRNTLKAVEDKLIRNLYSIGGNNES